MAVDEVSDGMVIGPPRSHENKLFRTWFLECSRSGSSKYLGIALLRFLRHRTARNHADSMSQWDC